MRFITRNGKPFTVLYEDNERDIWDDLGPEELQLYFDEQFKLHGEEDTEFVGNEKFEELKKLNNPEYYESFSPDAKKHFQEWDNKFPKFWHRSHVSDLQYHRKSFLDELEDYKEKGYLRNKIYNFVEMYKDLENEISNCFPINGVPEIITCSLSHLESHLVKGQTSLDHLVGHLIYILEGGKE